MDKFALMLTALVIVIGSIMIMPNEVLIVANAIYSIPPTPAWQNIGIANNQTYTTNNEGFIHANNSSDTFFFASDGSINISIIEFTP